MLLPCEGGLDLLPCQKRYSRKSGTELETSGASKQACPPKGPKFCLLKRASDNRTGSPMLWCLFSTLEMYLCWAGAISLNPFSIHLGPVSRLSQSDSSGQNCHHSRKPKMLFISYSFWPFQYNFRESFSDAKSSFVPLISSFCF